MSITFSKNKGFTLIELIIAMGFFAVMSLFLFSQLTSVYQFRKGIELKNQLNAEASTILNNGLLALVRSAYAINYDQTQVETSQSVVEGVNEAVDHISFFTNRAENQYFTVYRKPYQTEGDASDTAVLYLKFSNGDEFPLHTSEVVVEAFDLHVPSDPRMGGDQDIHPYVQLNMRVRTRHPLGQVLPEDSFKNHQIIRSSYQTTITLRNAGPANNKQPIS